MKFGLCCISLKLKEQGLSHQTMTYKRFSSLPREEALKILGDRIQNNLMVTNETIKFCAENNYVYRVSSDIFPLITYDEANVSLEDLPNHDEIQDEVIEKTIVELNFYSSFFDRIGLPANTNAAMNLHVHNNNGTREEISHRFYENFKRLDENCQKRMTIENDDKLNCWSVRELVDIFHPITRIPICFDYLHHKCHPNNTTEVEAINMCYDTWQTRPLFHYSESRPGNNPRAHADYAEVPFETYGLDFDVDMELKAKDLAIEKYEQICKGILV
jgi:UV DNA damage endonuclease